MIGVEMGTVSVVNENWPVPLIALSLICCNVVLLGCSKPATAPTQIKSKQNKLKRSQQVSRMPDIDKYPVSMNGKIDDDWPNHSSLNKGKKFSNSRWHD